jgi:hypothetical protein
MQELRKRELEIASGHRHEKQFCPVNTRMTEIAARDKSNGGDRRALETEWRAKYASPLEQNKLSLSRA